LVNQIHLSLVRAICNDIEAISATQTSAANQADTQENSLLINSIIKLDENKDQLWTEMVRILIAHADER
jgi:hypothetical protein